MKTFMMILLFFMSTSAFASHPHDRVCVVNVPATAKTEAVQFIFQWEIERTYENGSSSLDPHLVTAEASFCLMDWQDDNCTKSKSAAMVLKPGENQVALKLIDTKGQTFFEGTFNTAQEILSGKVSTVDNAAVSFQSKMTCISQPRLTLDAAPALH